VDIPLVGGQFTWSNNQEEEIWSRIDRFLFSPSWEEQYLTVKQIRLQRLCSDHFPLLLDCGDSRGGRKYFKFENMWLKYEGFVDKVKSWWDSNTFDGLPSFVLANMLKSLKPDLKNWNEEVFGDIGRKKKKELLEGIQEMDVLAEDRGLTEVEKSKMANMSRELENTLLCEEIHWRQIFFLISHKDFIKKRKVPQKYIGYIQKGHLTRKRKVGKKICIAKRQRGKISHGLRIQGIQQRG
jgi:hypothetical protein